MFPFVSHAYMSSWQALGEKPQDGNRHNGLSAWGLSHGKRVEKASYNPQYQVAWNREQRQLWCQLCSSHMVIAPLPRNLLIKEHRAHLNLPGLILIKLLIELRCHLEPAAIGDALRGRGEASPSVPETGLRLTHSSHDFLSSLPPTPGRSAERWTKYIHGWWREGRVQLLQHDLHWNVTGQQHSKCGYRASIPDCLQNKKTGRQCACILMTAGSQVLL